MTDERSQRQVTERLKALATILSDPFSPVHDPQGYSRAYVEAAMLIESDPGLLRRSAPRDALGLERVATLRMLPTLDNQSVPESQRKAVQVMRELTTAATEQNVADPQVIARMVAIHRRHRGGTHYDVNLGGMRAGIAQSFMEAPSRRRRRKLNPTPQLHSLGVGEATERVMRATDRLIASDDSRTTDVPARAREIQVIAELIARYPRLLEKDYLRRKLGQRRLERLSAIFG